MMLRSGRSLEAVDEMRKCKKDGVVVVGCPSSSPFSALIVTFSSTLLLLPDGCATTGRLGVARGFGTNAGVVVVSKDDGKHDKEDVANRIKDCTAEDEIREEEDSEGGDDADVVCFPAAFKSVKLFLLGTTFSDRSC